MRISVEILILVLWRRVCVWRARPSFLMLWKCGNPYSSTLHMFVEITFSNWWLWLRCMCYILMQLLNQNSINQIFLLKEKAKLFICKKYTLCLCLLSPIYSLTLKTKGLNTYNFSVMAATLTVLQCVQVIQGITVEVMCDSFSIQYTLHVDTYKPIDTSYLSFMTKCLEFFRKDFSSEK